MFGPVELSDRLGVAQLVHQPHRQLQEEQDQVQPLHGDLQAGLPESPPPLLHDGRALASPGLLGRQLAALTRFVVLKFDASGAVFCDGRHRAGIATKKASPHGELAGEALRAA